MDGFYDFGASGGEVVVTGGGFIDEDKGGGVADADAVDEFTFETALFDQPAGVDFEAVVTVVDGDIFGFGGFGFVFGEVDVFKERAGGSFLGWVGELVTSDGRDDVADAGGGEVGTVVLVDVAFDRVVKWAGHSAWF